MSPTTAALYISRVRLHNFRGIEDLEVCLHPKLTLLLGRNNVGKSRILRAIAIATGGEQPSEDDLTHGDEAQGPCFIDVEIAPLDSSGQPSESFDGVTRQAIGRSAQRVPRNGVDGDGLAWRTSLRASQEGGSPRREQLMLARPAGHDQWTADSETPLPRQLQRLVQSTLILPGRDLSAELRRRGTAASRLLKDLSIDPARAAELESELDGLSRRILTASKRLSDVKSTVADLAATSDTVGLPTITALPATLDELGKNVDINLQSEMSDTALPLRFHGSGARSLTSIVIHSAMYRHLLGADEGDLRPQPLTLVEEPEAHLHPSAQYDLADQLLAMPGQVVAATHSAHIATVAPPEAVRRLRHHNGTLVVRDVLSDTGGTTPPGSHDKASLWDAADLEKLNKLAERPFGEILFSDAIVLADGATERAMLPVVLRAALGHRSSGITVIDPGSMDNPNAESIVKFAKRHHVPCLLFVDDDKSGRKAVKKLTKHQSEEFTLTIASYGGGHDTEPYFVQHHPQVARDVCDATNGQSAADTADMLAHLKVVKRFAGRYYGESLAKHITESTTPSRPVSEPAAWPEPFDALIRWAMEAVKAGAARRHGA